MFGPAQEGAVGAAGIGSPWLCGCWDVLVHRRKHLYGCTHPGSFFRFRWGTKEIKADNNRPSELLSDSAMRTIHVTFEN